MTILLFVVCFYVAACAGISMKTQTIPEFSVSTGWIVVFPILYLYAFFALLRAKICHPFQLVRLFVNSSIPFFLLLKEIQKAEMREKGELNV